MTDLELASTPDLAREFLRRFPAAFVIGVDAVDIKGAPHDSVFFLCTGSRITNNGLVREAYSRFRPTRAIDGPTHDDFMGD